MKGKFKFEMLTKLSDGTDIIFDGEFVMGTEVFTLDENGSKVAVSDKTYELEGGQMFTTVNGKISEITEMEDEVTIVEETPETETKTELQMALDKIAEFETKMKELEEKIQTFMETFTLKNEQQTAMLEFSKVTETVVNPNVYTSLQNFFKESNK